MVEKVTSENIKDAAKVYFESWRVSHSNICSNESLQLHDRKYQLNYLEDKLKNGWELFIHYTDNNANGIVGLNYTTGEIGLLYVLPDKWHKGYGLELLDFAVKKMSRCNIPFLIVLDTNKRAMQIYEKYGFTYSGEKSMLLKEKDIYELKYNYLPEFKQT